MLDDLIELILEIVLEFLVEIFPRIEVPRAVNMVLSALLLLIGFGITNATNWMVVLGSVIIVVMSLWLGVQIRRFRY